MRERTTNGKNEVTRWSQSRRKLIMQVLALRLPR